MSKKIYQIYEIGKEMPRKDGDGSVEVDLTRYKSKYKTKRNKAKRLHSDAML